MEGAFSRLREALITTYQVPKLYLEETIMQKQREEILPYPLEDSSVFQESALNIEMRRRPSRLYSILKRLIDIVIPLVGLILLMPVFLIIAVCIKLDDGGDILYRREMVGQRGRPFLMLKFRTMIPNAEAYLIEHPELLREYQQNMKLKQDPRITRVGRFLRSVYLDELPQLFNILLGQMSLVGPRAIHKRELELYGEWAQKRHSVKPGLTGLWQISSNRHDCYEERIPLDMHYVDNCSFILDLVILLKTLKVFIERTGL
jgi:lipopolysaccharide/colanic/teichoic acid biosynthesis glycosyltransferase